MSKLTKRQPETLLDAVKFANRHGGVLPTAKELSEILSENERAVSARLKRIIEANPSDFIINGRTRRINYNAICTEKETATFLLKVNDSLNFEGRITIDEALKLNTFNSRQEGLNFINKLSGAGYIQSLIVDSQQLRLTQKFYKHIKFLKLLSES